jgi:exodeoxyribonuclease III
MKLLTLNVANPSPAKAQRQLLWLAERDDDLIVLTETGPGPGSLALADALAFAGYEICWERPPADERGVMIASRLRVVEASPRLSYLPWRACAVRIADSGLLVAGAYVPSRDASDGKTTRKRRFIAELCGWLDTQWGAYDRLILGDFNVLDRQHVPRYPFFKEWEYSFFDTLKGWGLVDAFRLMHPDAHEYSWVDRSGSGYRYDHTFVEGAITNAVTTCSYIQTTRHDQLSDHAAMTMEIDVLGEVPRRLVGRVTSQQPVLF